MTRTIDDVSYSANRTCAACQAHYGDGGPCDEGKPLASPHRAQEQLPVTACDDVVMYGACLFGCGDKQ